RVFTAQRPTLKISVRETVGNFSAYPKSVRRSPQNSLPWDSETFASIGALLIGEELRSVRSATGCCAKSRLVWMHRAYPRLSAGAGDSGRQTPVSRAMVVGLEDRQKARKYGPAFRKLFQWSVPKSVVRAVEARGFSVQTIDAAVGDLNLDRYPV